MTRKADNGIEVELRIAASPEIVFEFLTDPRRFVQWLGVAASLDPQPGGVFRVNVNSRDIVSGKYVEVVPHRRVVFTWGWEGGGGRIPPGSSTVEITLEPDGEGTLLRLKHTGLRTQDEEKHAAGWSHYTQRLKTVAEGRDPGEDPLASADIVHG